ncbi:MAG: phosphoribosyltransferase family protein [Candidatus Saccharimonadales bacterium]
MFDPLIATVAPFECLICNKEGDIICRQCQPKAISRKASTCFMCNKLTKDFRACATCKRKTKASGVVVASHYKGAIKELVQSFKYHRAMAGCRVAAQLIAPALNNLDINLITAMPTATHRFRQRGYNQSVLIAKHLAIILNVPFTATLSRHGQNRQVGTNRAKRISQLQGAMYCINRNLAGKKILVVDDVLTTGASMNEAAAVLKSKGAKSVWGAVLAKH